MVGTVIGGKYPHRRRARAGRYGRDIPRHTRDAEQDRGGQDDQAGVVRIDRDRAALPARSACRHQSRASEHRRGVRPWTSRRWLAVHAMEFVDGVNLKDVIGASGPMPPGRIVRLLTQVASALARAHRNHIVHRDLKPQNLVIATDVGGDERVKLLDFGIAKTFEEGATQLTAAGYSLGTPHYMAPEQAVGEEVDGRADIYALGVILYEMLVGDVPFDATSAPAVLVKHLNDAPEPPSHRRPDLQESRQHSRPSRSVVSRRTGRNGSRPPRSSAPRSSHRCPRTHRSPGQCTRRRHVLRRPTRTSEPPNPLPGPLSVPLRHALPWRPPHLRLHRPHYRMSP